MLQEDLNIPWLSHVTFRIKWIIKSKYSQNIMWPLIKNRKFRNFSQRGRGWLVMVTSFQSHCLNSSTTSYWGGKIRGQGVGPFWKMFPNLFNWDHPFKEDGNITFPVCSTITLVLMVAVLYWASALESLVFQTNRNILFNILISVILRLEIIVKFFLWLFSCIFFTFVLYVTN